MTVKRGEIWLANLNPVQGSEQAGMRPVLILQNDLLSRFTTTLLAVPLTTNLKRAALASCVLIPQGEGGLSSDSVALGHQLRVLDQTLDAQARHGQSADNCQPRKMHTLHLGNQTYR